MFKLYYTHPRADTIIVTVKGVLYHIEAWVEIYENTNDTIFALMELGYKREGIYVPIKRTKGDIICTNE